ncbi:hypothetical protein LWI28_000753 [Acer negundo]|uniref:Uncharacterized protein n=1 Tax=Acer negundo TaxID=4023 RepID=A0AAD5IXA1_ACENE|nr:hypothetical protein LWI28_000753 [Acer negundo]
MLLKSLVFIGATLGLVLWAIGTSVPWLFPGVFTPDQNVIQEMHKVLLPYLLALAVTPSTHSLEGTLRGPANALWICEPLPSLIDTAVIGQGSSIELAALGPGTVYCDNIA